MHLSVTSASSSFLLFSTLLLYCHAADATDSGTFFLKAAKNVPRIGRRSGAGDNTFFLKATKNVPRIGRRGGSALTEMRESGGWPWFRNQDNILPSRIARTGPASITTGLWDSPSRLPSPRLLASSSSISSLRSQPENQYVWRSMSSEQDNDLASPIFHYDINDDDVSNESASQLLAPPAQQFPSRLPQEGAFPRQRGSENQS